MVWEASDEGVLALLGCDVEVEVEVSIDLADKVLDLTLVDENEGLGVVVDIPEVVAAVEVSEVVTECTSTYRSHSRAQNLAWSKKAEAMGWERFLLHHLYGYFESATIGE